MIPSFKQYLVEEERSVYFTFGRMNPPTIGHGKLLEKIANAAGRNPYRIYLSQSSDPKKNPLSYTDKIKHARKMFPKYARQIMINKNAKTAMDVATALYNEGFKKIVMVVGSDRVREFEVLLNKYNGVKSRHGLFAFESIKVISAGERDPDADDASGASATKQRQAAAENNYTAFGQGVPKTMSNADARKLFNDVRKGMGLKEEKTFKRHVELAPVSELREAYVHKKLFELGEQVVINKTGVVGEIQFLGSNYVVVEAKSERWRCWLDDVSKVDPNNEPKYDVFNEAVSAPKPKTDRWYKNQPEWGTPESTKKMKKQVPGQEKCDVTESESWKSEGHYTSTGKEWKGDQHYHNGMVMTGKTHTKDSQQLYHYKELPKEIRKKIEASLGEASEVSKARDNIDRENALFQQSQAKERERLNRKHDRILDAARRTAMLKRNAGVKK